MQVLVFVRTLNRLYTDMPLLSLKVKPSSICSCMHLNFSYGRACVSA